MFNEKKKLENKYMERRKEFNNNYKFKEPELKNSEINNKRK